MDWNRKMKINRIAFILCTLLILSFSLYADKYAGEIFKMGAGVNNFALGSTGVTDTNGSSAAYWNPALLTYHHDNTFEVMHAEEFAGLVKYDTFSGILGKTNRIAFVITRIGNNNIPLTHLENDSLPPSVDNQPITYKTVNNSDYIAYIGFGRTINDKLSIGMTPKIAYRSLAEHSGYGFGADLGGYYQIQDNWSVGARLADFFTTQLFWQNGTHEIVNPSLDLETQYGIKVTKAKIPVIAYLRTEIMSEGRKEMATTSMGPISMDYHAGLEVKPISNITLMAGYDVQNITAGMSITYRIISLQYAYKQEPKADLESCQRISIGIKF
jgi:hypothetical protein